METVEDREAAERVALCSPCQSTCLVLEGVARIWVGAGVGGERRLGGKGGGGGCGGAPAVTAWLPKYRLRGTAQSAVWEFHSVCKPRDQAMGWH
jgi:hypothetical protein